MKWFQNAKHLGIGAGTSTPHSQIEAVKKKIVELYLGKVVFREGKPEEEFLEETA